MLSAYNSASCEHAEKSVRTRMFFTCRSVIGCRSISFALNWTSKISCLLLLCRHTAQLSATEIGSTARLAADVQIHQYLATQNVQFLQRCAVRRFNGSSTHSQYESGIS